MSGGQKYHKKNKAGDGMWVTRRLGVLFTQGGQGVLFEVVTSEQRLE